MATLTFGHPRAPFLFFFFNLPAIVSDIVHLSVEKANQPMVRFLPGWSQHFDSDCQNPLCSKVARFGLYISKQLQSAQSFCQRFCVCQKLYKYFHIWCLGLSPRISPRVNTLARTKEKKRELRFNVFTFQVSTLGCNWRGAHTAQV